MCSGKTSKKLTGRVLLLPGFEWCPVGRGKYVAMACADILVDAVRTARGKRGGRKVVSSAAAGSRLFLEAEEFQKALKCGCPLRYLLGVYKWPVRSAVVLCLCRVFLSVPGALRYVPTGLRLCFLGAARATLRGAAPMQGAEVPVFSGVATVGGLVDAMGALQRGLSWLYGRNQACPPALRGAVALLAELVSNSL